MSDPIVAPSKIKGKVEALSRKQSTSVDCFLSGLRFGFALSNCCFKDSPRKLQPTCGRAATQSRSVLQSLGDVEVALAWFISWACDRQMCAWFCLLREHALLFILTPNASRGFLFWHWLAILSCNHGLLFLDMCWASARIYMLICIHKFRFLYPVVLHLW